MLYILWILIIRKLGGFEENLSTAPMCLGVLLDTLLCPVMVQIFWFSISIVVCKVSFSNHLPQGQHIPIHSYLSIISVYNYLICWNNIMPPSAGNTKLTHITTESKIKLDLFSHFRKATYGSNYMQCTNLVNETQSKQKSLGPTNWIHKTSRSTTPHTNPRANLSMLT